MRYPPLRRLCTAVLVPAAFLIGSGGAYAGDSALEFRAGLSGAQEVPEVPTVTTGDVRVEFNADLSRFEFELIVRDGVGITQAHLHCGRPGENGPIVVFLFPDMPPALSPPGVDINGELAKGTRSNADIRPTAADCVTAIGRVVNNIASLAFAARDGLVYANVHTVARPGGEVRGQLLEKD